MTEEVEASETAAWGDAADVEDLRRYRTLANAIDEGLFQLDTEERFVAVNDTIVEITGYAREDLLGEHVSVVLDGDGRTALERELERLCTDTEGRSDPIECTIRTAGSDRRRCDVRVNPLGADDAAQGTVGIVRDITETTPPEKDRQRVIQALEAANEGISLIDDDGRFIHVNEAYAGTFGYDPEEMVGEHWDALGIEADSDQFYDDILPRIAEEGQWTGTTTGVRSDGSTFLAQHSLTATDDEELICVVRDVTDREQRKRNLEQYARIVETVNDGIYVLDADSRFTRVNDAFCEMTGYAREDLLGTHASLVHSDAIDARASAKIDDVLDDERDAAVMNVNITTSDGDVVPVESWIAPFPFDDGSYGRVGVVRDVTERVERERTLRQTREQLEVATSAGAVGTWTWDIQADVVTADEYLAEAYGVDPDVAAAGAPMDAFYEPIHEDDEEEAWARLERAVEETGELEVEYRVRDADGELRWMLSRGEVEYDDDGEPVRMHGAVSDITDRKRAERRTNLLETLGRELQPLADPDEIVAVTARLLGDHLDVDRCAYAEIEGDGDHFTVTGDYTRGETASIEGEGATSAFGEAGLRLMRQTQPYVVDDVETDERLSAADRTTYRQTRSRAVLCAPVHKDGRFVAGMAVHQETPREWHPHEVELVETVVRRCWESLQRARTVRDLRESEHRYRALAENFPNGVVALVDENLHYRTVGGAPQDVAGVTADELESGPVREVLPPELADELCPRYEAALAGESSMFEATFEDRTFEFRVVPVRDDDGEVFAALGMSQDITERMEYERRIEESERRYRALAENFPNGGVGVYDRELRYTLVTGTMWDDIEPDAADLQGRTIREALPPDTVDDVEPLFRAALDGETGSVVSTLGGRIYRVWATPLRDAEGEITAGQSFALDITERVEREQELKEQNERLERFASMLAHELRNPVAIGQIYSRQLPDETDSEAVEYVTEAFDRIEDMIDVMLVLTREQEALGERNRLSLGDVARNAWDDVDAPDATLEVDVEAELLADETYVRHLFRNLFENAVQHGGAGVTVRVGRSPDGFYVADDGSGIPAEDRDAIFGAGFTTAANGDGTGLGLAFVSELADVYGWTCTMSRSDTGGARVEFRDVNFVPDG